MKVLDAFPTVKRGRTTNYDWATIFNGSVNVCEKGTDFECALKSFRVAAYKAAEERDLTIRTAIDTEAGTVAVLVGPAESTEA